MPGKHEKPEDMSRKELAEKAAEAQEAEKDSGIHDERKQK